MEEIYKQIQYKNKTNHWNPNKLSPQINRLLLPHYSILYNT